MYLILESPRTKATQQVREQKQHSKSKIKSGTTSQQEQVRPHHGNGLVYEIATTEMHPYMLPRENGLSSLMISVAANPVPVKYVPSSPPPPKYYRSKNYS
jgi:hypothetical protein